MAPSELRGAQRPTRSAARTTPIAYVELAAPVLKNLEIDAALRYDHYNAPNANTWNPKVGVKWTPMQELALRGTAGTGFRAPYITGRRAMDRRAPPATVPAPFNLTGIRDPLLCPEPQRQRHAEPDVARTTSAASTPGCTLQTSNTQPGGEQSELQSDKFNRGLRPGTHQGLVDDLRLLLHQAQEPDRQLGEHARSFDPDPDNAVRNHAADRDLRRRPHRTFLGRPRRVRRRAFRQRATR